VDRAVVRERGRLVIGVTVGPFIEKEVMIFRVLTVGIREKEAFKVDCLVLSIKVESDLAIRKDETTIERIKGPLGRHCSLNLGCSVIGVLTVPGTLPAVPFILSDAAAAVKPPGKEILTLSKC
jgi:hypothetical protein